MPELWQNPNPNNAGTSPPASGLLEYFQAAMNALQAGNEELRSRIMDLRAELADQGAKHAERISVLTRETADTIYQERERHREQNDRLREVISDLKEQIADLNADLKISEWEVANNRPETDKWDKIVENVIPFVTPFLANFTPSAPPPPVLPAKPEPRKVPAYAGDGAMEMDEPVLETNMPADPNEIFVAEVTQGVDRLVRANTIESLPHFLEDLLSRLKMAFGTHYAPSIGAWVQSCQTLISFYRAELVTQDQLFDVVNTFLSRAFDLGTLRLIPTDAAMAIIQAHVKLGNDAPLIRSIVERLKQTV